MDEKKPKKRNGWFGSMVKVFSGRWRGLGQSQSGLGLVLDFEFRGYLKYFRGARLPVFLNILLHSDQDGWAYPSYELMKSETDLSMDSIARALDDLCQMKIDDHRILLRWRERDETTKRFVGSNWYLVFPNPKEVQRYEIEKANKREPIPDDDDGDPEPASVVDPADEPAAVPPSENQNVDGPHSENQNVDGVDKKPDSDFPNSAFSEFGKIGVKDKPSFNGNHSLNNGVPVGTPVGDAIPVSGMIKNPAAFRALRAFENQADKIDLADYPERYHALIREFCKHTGMVPPRKNPKFKNGGSGYSGWCSGLAQLKEACGEFGLEVIRVFFMVRNDPGKSDYKFNVFGPVSLVNSCLAIAGTMRLKEWGKAGGNQATDDQKAIYELLYGG